MHVDDRRRQLSAGYSRDRQEDAHVVPGLHEYIYCSVLRSNGVRICGMGLLRVFILPKDGSGVKDKPRRMKPSAAFRQAGRRRANLAEGPRFRSPCSRPAGCGYVCPEGGTRSNGVLDFSFSDLV
jgi:hypothetical protein